MSQHLSCKVLLNFWPSCINHISCREWVDHHLARCCWISGITFCPVCELTIVLGVVKFLTTSHHIWCSLWVHHCLARCCWISDHLVSYFVQFVSWLLYHNVLLNCSPSCITFHPGCESSVILQGVVEFLTISHHISFSLWVIHCLTRCYWIPDHLTWHFVQFVSRLSSCKVLLNFWPSHVIICPVGEPTAILQGVVEFLTISHDMLSSLWVDQPITRWCWISDHLAWYVVQLVSCLLSYKMLLNFWPSHITFCSVGESIIALQSVVEFLTILHILSSWWVSHCLARFCWIYDHLTSHFVQLVSRPSSCKVLFKFLTILHHILSSWWVNHSLTRCSWISDHLEWYCIQGVSWPSSCKVPLNLWPSLLTFHPGSESTVILQSVKFLTIWHHILSSLWVDYCLARCCWI